VCVCVLCHFVMSTHPPDALRRPRDVALVVGFAYPRGYMRMLMLFALPRDVCVGWRCVW
jgi:hypothetical protein